MMSSRFHMLNHACWYTTTVHTCSRGRRAVQAGCRVHVGLCELNVHARMYARTCTCTHTYLCTYARTHGHAHAATQPTQPRASMYMNGTMASTAVRLTDVDAMPMGVASSSSRPSDESSS